MAQQEPIGRGTEGSNREIPDKLYFRIGEVARLCEVPAYVLRFWETEFPLLKPHKGGTGQRLYRRRDVEMALRVKTLLYDQGYTIPGARQVFKAEHKLKEPQLALGIEEPAGGGGRDHLAKLKKLRREMQELLAVVSKPVAEGAAAKGRAVHPIRMPRTAKGHTEKPVAAAEGLFGEPLFREGLPASVPGDVPEGGEEK
jgi:DNA-binding transcriptional MerR regulator